LGTREFDKAKTATQKLKSKFSLFTMMRSSRMGGGSMLRAGKEAFSIGAGSSTARGGGADVRKVSVPSPLPPTAATSPTFAGGSAAWSDWENVHPEVEREEGEAEEELPEFWYLETVPRSEEIEAAIWNLQQLVPFSILNSYNYFMTISSHIVHY
jgi:hypothetical protein